MRAIKIDMCAGPSEPVGTFRFERQGLSSGKQFFRAGLNLLAKRVFCRATGAAAGFGTVPTDQAEADAFIDTLQFECVAVDGDDISNGGADTSTAGLVAQIGRLRPGTIVSAGGEHNCGQKKGRAHAGN